MPGPVAFDQAYVESLKRTSNMLVIEHTVGNGSGKRSPFPPLHDPELLAFKSDRAIMFRGWEEIDGKRYYQGWYIEFQWPDTSIELHTLRRLYERISGEPWDFEALTRIEPATAPSSTD